MTEISALIINYLLFTGPIINPNHLPQKFRSLIMISWGNKQSTPMILTLTYWLGLSDVFFLAFSGERQAVALMGIPTAVDTKSPHRAMGLFR